MAYVKKSGSFSKKSFGTRAAGPRTFDRPTERFQATCSECHKACEVPFRPNGKKPVYCRDCFKSSDDAATHGPRKEYRSPVSGENFSMQLELLNTKLDRLLAAVEGWVHR